MAQQQMQNQGNVQQVLNSVGQAQNTPMSFVPGAQQMNQGQQPWGAYGQMQPQQPYYNQQGMQSKKVNKISKTILTFVILIGNYELIQISSLGRKVNKIVVSKLFLLIC